MFGNRVGAACLGGALICLYCVLHLHLELICVVLSATFDGWVGTTFVLGLFLPLGPTPFLVDCGSYYAVPSPPLTPLPQVFTHEGVLGCLDNYDYHPSSA